MQDQSAQLDLLQRAIEIMAEQLLAMERDLAILRRELQASDQRQLHLMSRVDEIDAMRASLSNLERRVSMNITSNQTLHLRASRRRRLTWILLSLAGLVAGWIFTFRGSLFNQSQHDVLRPQPSRSTKPVTTILMIATKEPTWLEVQTSDGRLLHFGIAQKGQYHFQVVQSLRIRAGRPDLVKVTFRGSTTTLGTIESTGWHMYSRS